MAGGGRGVDGAARARTLVDLVRRNVDQLVRRREVGFSLSATKLTGGSVVSTCRLLGGVEGTEPNAAFLAGITDLGGVSAPRPLTNATEMKIFTIVVGKRRKVVGGGFFLGNHGGG